MMNGEKTRSQKSEISSQRFGAIVRWVRSLGSVGCFLFVVLGFAGSVSATPLDDQMAAFKKADKQTDAAVANILKTGLEESRAAEAVAAVKAWLDNNPSSSLSVDYYAGMALKDSGDWHGAIGFYRKALKNSSLDPKLAGDVVTATYRMLINEMREPDSAYMLMREDGNRLRTYGSAKQYDGWFLDEAKRRNDLPAVCGRMEVIFGTAPSNVVPDTSDLEWICGKLESFRPEDASWYEAAQKLAAVPRVPAEYKARMEWAATVVPYNRKLDKFRENKEDNIAKKHTDASLAAAEKLLTVAPDKGAFLVANGWGFEYDHYHSGNCQKRFEVDGERKLAQLLAVIPRMSPDKRDDLLAYPIAQGRVKFDPKDVRKLVLQFPGMLNTLTAGNVQLFDATLTVAEAQALSPQLARNPHAHAAMVRAYAVAGTNTVSAIVPAIMKSEMWRFDSANSAIDSVWNSGANREGADHTALCKQYANLGARYDQVKKQVAKEASSQDRQSAFNELQGDLLGAAPSIPGIMPLWGQLFANAPETNAVAMLKSMLGNIEGDREHLLRVAVAAIPGVGGHAIYVGPEWDGFMHNGPQNARYKAAVAPLVPELQRILNTQVQTGRISEYLLAIWLHAANPQDESARTLMKTLAASAAYVRLDPAYQRVAADVGHFGRIAMTPAMLATDTEYISRELLALTTNAAPAEIEAAFNTVIARAEIAPVPVPVYGLHKVAALPEMSSAVRASLLHLFGRLAPLGDYPRAQGYEQAALRLIQDLQKQKQWKVVVPYAAGLWRSAAMPDDNSYRVREALTAFAEAAIQDGANSPAFSIARIGRKIRLPGEGMNPQTLARLGTIEAKVSRALGFSEIPVDETNPLYPIFRSNAEFEKGNLDSAWLLYKENAALLKPKPGTQEQSVLRKLPLEYSFWLIRGAIDANLTDNAEEIVKELTVWSRQAAGTFTAEQDAELKLAYADLMFKRGKLPVARAWYRKVADAREYNNTLLHVRGMLGSINIDRVTKNFGTALEDVEKLMRDADVGSRAKVHYAKAEVLMDQENFKDALEEVTTVLRGEPGNPDALILKGKIQYQMRKWVEASEIELGVSQANKTMVPGETLKISLVDPTLSISGVGADIEVEVWAKSGDKERVLLYPMGDSKDKFRAEVPTMLAAPVAGDKTLQVLGVDEIRFGYSERFRAKMKDLPPDPKVVITIAADAQMAISAGAFPPREGERKLDIEELGLSTAQLALGMRSVRPGNPVYIRVIDPDKSKTAAADSLTVNVQSSSGDVIRQLVLKETGPYTGEFQGIFPTAGAQAMAFASESAPGRDPNMAVSSKAYPGWLGKVGDAEAPRTFGVDLNDNAVLGKMTVRYGEPGNQLTHFVIQTSVNGIEWMTRARYPDPGGAWDGRPHVSSFFVNGNWAIGVSKPKGLELPADWLQSMDYTSIRSPSKFRFATVKSLSAEPTPLPIATQHFASTVALIRYRALFYQPAAAIRKFRLTGQPEGDTIFLLDGQPADKTAQDPMTVERRIEPGLHEIQVWFHSGQGKPVLLCDIEGKAEMQPCPDSMFDPTTFPEGVRKKLPQQAKIIETPDGGGIDVEFGDSTSARLVRLYIVGFKGLAPSIKALTLTDSAGKVHFPVKEDFMTLRDNQQLEVLPGDQVTVRYEDDVTATPNRNKLEQSLLVAFNTASITASFLNYETTAEGRKLVLEPIRRFRHGDAVAIIIDDADMDSKPEPDVIEFKVSASGGSEVVIKALETEKNSGRFIGRVFPVIGKPARESEIQILPGGTITAIYRDQENLNPGIPADRTVTIEHAQYTEPKFGAYTVASTKIAVAEGSGGKAAAKAAGSAGEKRNAPEVFVPRRTLNYTYVADPGASGQDMSAVIGASLRFDVVVPHLALAASSEIAAYVQTDKARKANATNSASASKVFDIGVPGTLKLMAKPRWVSASVPPAYTLGRSPVPPSTMAALDEGRFSFSVPLILGDKPVRSFAAKDAESLPDSSIPEGVAVNDGDIVHAGFAYKDTAGNLQWKTASFTVGSHSFLDVMNETYNEPLTSAFVGEKVFVRVIAPGLDAGPERDMTSVSLSSGSNVTSSFSLRETEAHSGVFKGVFTLGYAEQVVPAKLPPVELNGFPVRYGEQLTVAYSAAGEDAAQTAAVTVNKGADGMVEPFTKRFAGDEMAAKTSFTLAECFFELAKKHSQMDQESLARREFEHAQKLLDEAIATHRDEELRAHAEYLSGNLAQEYADLAKNDEAKTEKYQQALKRFMKIPVDYPKSEFAPKAQYKTALVYEKMKELEIAVEEYVKLAYKYPESEHIPEVMSRLGGYFQSKGQVFKEQADLLREKTDMESKAEVIKLDEKSYPEFLKAALIFGKLVERFPDHELAGLAGLRSSQNYMRVHQYQKAIDGFEKLVDNETYDANEIRSQALFWMGLSYERISAAGGDALNNAYKTYRRVTFDFPDSKYAKMARGRLSDPVFAKIIEVEEELRQRMIGAMKEEKKNRR